MTESAQVADLGIERLVRIEARIGDAARGERYRKECMRGSHPTKGVVVPIGDLVSEIMQAGKRLGS